MNEISYDERAKFYDNEVTVDSTKIDFFRKIKEALNINTSIYCPCATGIYLDSFSKIFTQSIFADINPNMIKKISEKLGLKKISNITTEVIDIKKMNEINQKIDCIFVLDQAVQYINRTDFKKFLINSYYISKYIVLDMFDFKKEGILSYFNSNFITGDFYESKRFKVDGKTVVRTNKHLFYGDNKITFYYHYKTDDNREYSTEFTLNNYSYKSTLDVINETKLYKVINEYKDYQMGDYDSLGHFIIILEKI